MGICVIKKVQWEASGEQVKSGRVQGSRSDPVSEDALKQAMKGKKVRSWELKLP
jgi:hypothetical protein